MGFEPPHPNPLPTGERERTEMTALVSVLHPLVPAKAGTQAFVARMSVQAVAAPMCTCRLADAGARVIKVERPEGDFARYYDKLAVPRTRSAPSPIGRGRGEGLRSVDELRTPSPRPSPQRGEGAERASGGEEKGESAYFVWLNRGKESVVLDLARADDKALLSAML